PSRTPSRSKNFGPNRAENTVVTDTLPSDVTFVSASATKGTFKVPPVGQNGTVNWDIGEILTTGQEEAQIVVTVTPNGKTTITNTVTVTSTTPDPNPVNNVASISATVQPVFAGTPGRPDCHGTSVSALARQYGGLSNAASALGFSSVQ